MGSSITKLLMLGESSCANAFGTLKKKKKKTQINISKWHFDQWSKALELKCECSFYSFYNYIVISLAKNIGWCLIYKIRRFTKYLVSSLFYLYNCSLLNQWINKEKKESSFVVNTVLSLPQPLRCVFVRDGCLYLYLHFPFGNIHQKCWLLSLYNLFLYLAHCIFPSACLSSNGLSFPWGADSQGWCFCGWV